MCSFKVFIMHIPRITDLMISGIRVTVITNNAASRTTDCVSSFMNQNGLLILRKLVQRIVEIVNSVAALS